MQKNTIYYSMHMKKVVVMAIILLKKVLKEFVGKTILVLVGPEGGFSPEEVELLDKANLSQLA